MHIPFLVIGANQLIFILLIVLILFGGKKIPELMHGVGKGVKSFKDGLNGKDEPVEKKADDEKKD